MNIYKSKLQENKYKVKEAKRAITCPLCKMCCFKTEKEIKAMKRKLK